MDILSFENTEEVRLLMCSILVYLVDLKTITDNIELIDISTTWL